MLLTGRSRLRLSVLLGAIGLALLCTLAGLLVGPVKLPAGGVVHELAHHLPFLSVGHGLSPTDALILDQLRLPRVVLGLMVGGMLGMAGCAYQGVFRNPLADPYLLGSAAGAGFGATTAIALGATGAIGPSTRSRSRPSSARSSQSRAPTCSAAARARAPACSCSRASRWARSSRPADVRAAALGAEPAGDLLVHPRRHRDCQLARRRARLALRVRSAIVMLLHARVLDVLALGDVEASSLGVNVRRTRLSSSSPRPSAPPPSSR